MHICCFTCSLILNVMATQYTCSLNSIYHPHWLVQRSRHCSQMRILVHSPWLPAYIDIKQIILVILIMAGLFLDRPHMRCSGGNSFLLWTWGQKSFGSWREHQKESNPQPAGKSLGALGRSCRVASLGSENWNHHCTTKQVFECWQLKDRQGPSIGETVEFLHKASEILKWHIHFVK